MTDDEVPEGAIPRAQRRFEQALSASRMLVFIPVVLLLLTALGIFVYGVTIFVRSMHIFVGDVEHAGQHLALFVIVLDVFLTGITLMIASFGLYELFIAQRSGDRWGLPTWLRMRDLDDLKVRVVSMLIILASITFIDVLLEGPDGLTTLYMGTGVAVVVIALTFYMRYTHASVQAREPMAERPASELSGESAAVSARDRGQAAPSPGAPGVTRRRLIVLRSPRRRRDV